MTQIAPNYTDNWDALVFSHDNQRAKNTPQGKGFIVKVPEGNSQPGGTPDFRL